MSNISPMTNPPIYAYCPNCDKNFSNPTTGLYDCPVCHGPIDATQLKAVIVTSGKGSKEKVLQVYPNAFVVHTYSRIVDGVEGTSTGPFLGWDWDDAASRLKPAAESERCECGMLAEDCPWWNQQIAGHGYVSQPAPASGLPPQHYHDLHCNASRTQPMGCAGCSCYMNHKLMVGEI